MKGLAILMLLLFATSAFAGDWTLAFHMPSNDMVGGGACGSVGIAHPAGHTGRAIVRWSGPAAGADSLNNLADGALVAFARTNQPDGVYTFSVWVWDAGGYSCPMQLQKTVVTPDTTPPAQPADVTIVP